VVFSLSLSRQLFTALATVSKGIEYIDSRRVSCGLEYAYRLPVGLSCQDVQKDIDVLRAAVGAPVELVDRGGAVIVRVVEKDFPAQISFNPKHLKDDMLLIGYNRLMNPVYHRLMHLLVGGASSAGKTVWLRWFLYQLVRMKAIIKIADLKGFSFFPFETVPGVEIAKSLEETADMLFAAMTELERRENMIIAARDRSLTDRFTPYVVVIDEAAQISPAMNKSSKQAKGYAQFCDESVARLSQKGRETKVILIYCTQKPTADIVNGQVKANVETALAFRTNTHQESGVILGAQGAEKISIATPGRCLYRAETFHLLQVPFISEKDSEWDKLLTAHKTEVLQRGHSDRAEPQRQYLEGSYTRADSHNETTSHVKQQFTPAEEGKRHTPRLGTGSPRREPVSPKRKDMAAHEKRQDDLRNISDEIE
jgi:S-DNA-T family DNA segregation ATPase FtsK/SpoIIIE